MTANADLTRCVQCPKPAPSHDVHRAGDWLQVGGVNARTMRIVVSAGAVQVPRVAEVVKLKAVRDGADRSLVGEPVSPYRATLGNPEYAVSVGVGERCPSPAIARLVDLCPKTDLGAYGGSRHASILSTRWRSPCPSPSLAWLFRYRCSPWSRSGTSRENPARAVSPCVPPTRGSRSTPPPRYGARCDRGRV